MCEFVCGIDGCRFAHTARMDEWLPVRDAHRAEAHPEFRERKRRRHSIRGINKQTRYEKEAVA